jgi:tRNA threonylcarbamoyladenosine biosynthesis protein TsaE
MSNFASCAPLSPVAAGIKCSVCRNARARAGKGGGMSPQPEDIAEIKIFLCDADATRALGAQLGRASKPGTVILLDGPLGAGKTTLVQGFVAALDAAAAASPSFVVAHYYDGSPMPIWHLDLYRIENQAEIDDLDLEQYLPADGIALVEWAGRNTGGWPSERVEIEITLDGTGRRATVRGRGRCACIVTNLASATGAA